MSGPYIYVRSSKQKHLKRTKNEDRISKLPESLISCILSFLPTKDAVGTSVLSKTWVYRWTSITKLDIDDTFYSPKKKNRGKQNFINFLYRTLLLTKPSSFSLVLVHNHDVTLFNIWISNILIQRVKNLRIVTRFDMSFSAQASHFLFESFCLEELVLNMVSCAIRVTKTYVYFGQLKLLKLSGVLFIYDSVSDFNLCLPVLKVFETTNCAWLKAKRVTLKVPLLESVIIVQDAKSGSYATNNCAIEFSASHLKDFTYRGYDYISHFFKLQDPSSAHNASLTLTVSPCEKNKDTMIESRVVVLLRQFRKMKCLKFDGLQELGQRSVANLPLFGMLSHLDLGSVTGDVLLGLLLKSPILRTLVFEGISKFDQEFLNSAAVPECLTSTLQVVKFGSLYGFEDELCLAKFVMENGLMLERMSFSIGYWQRKSKVIEEFKQKLFSYKKAFSCAIIEFSHDWDVFE